MHRILFLSFVFLFIVVPATIGANQSARANAGKLESHSRIPKLPPVMTTYDVYVGGLHFLTAEILFEEQKNNYLTRMHAHTAGYLYKILKWDGNVSSTGRIKGDHLEPVTYSNLDSWK